VISEAKSDTLWNMIMRYSPAAIALSVCFALLSSAGLGKKPDYQIDPLSVAMTADGDVAAKAGKTEDAIGYYETALAVDPRNRVAYIAMARAVRSQGLNGKAIRFYKEALELDPNDLTALAEQGDAMVAKGAIEQAKKNLARLKLLCRSDCGKVDTLAMNISRAGQKPVLQASAVEVKPVVGDIAPAKAN
jgi:tetratricopeptide (TPR) repeat protein